MQNINWYVFTNEEKQEMQKLIDAGRVKDIACVITSVNMDVEKEIELQRIIDSYTPEDEDFISEVDNEVVNDFIEGVPNIDKTPELEAKFQEKLDTERKEYIEKKKAGRKKKQDSADKIAEELAAVKGKEAKELELEEKKSFVDKMLNK